MSTARYRLYGLTLDSSIDLPELEPVAITGPADVEIRRGAPDDETLPGFRCERVARYSVSKGTRIWVDAEPGADPRDVRLFILGSAMGMILHQRGILPLHGNAIDVGGKAMVFMGKSGAGKSTLAAWFHDRGHALLSDDVSVVAMRDETPWIMAGPPRLRLWRDALVRSGRPAEGFERSYLDDEEWDKFDVPIAQGRPGGLPLGAIFLLERGRARTIERLGGAAAVEAISANTYRGSWIVPLGDLERHWRTTLALASTVPVFRVTRPFDARRMDAVNGWLRDEALRLA